MIGPQTAVEAALLALDPEWLALADLLIGDGDDEVVADYVLMHPQRGVALIDVAPGHGGDPVGGFHRFLDHEGFADYFSGFLPVVAIVMKPEDAAQLEERLDAALASLPPLSIAEPDWAEMVNTLLVASETPPSGQSGVAEPEAGTEPVDEPHFATGDLAWPEPQRDASRPVDFDIARPTAKPAPTPPQAPTTMRGPVADDRFTPREERRRWPAVLAILVVLVGAGAGWAALHPSILSEAFPSLARLDSADRAPVDAASGAATPPLASSPAPAVIPPVAHDVPPATPTPPASPAATVPSPVAVGTADIPSPPPAAPPPSIATVAPLPEPAAPSPPAATPAPVPQAPIPPVATQVPVPQAPTPPAPSVATTDAKPASPDLNAPPQMPVANPVPRKALAAKSPPPAKAAPVKQALAAAPPPSQSREARREARRQEAAEATDSLNRAELQAPTQFLRLPPGQENRQDQNRQDQSGLAADQPGFGQGSPASRQAAPVEDRTVASLPPGYVSPSAPAQNAPTAAPGTLSRPMSLLPSSRGAAAPAVADNGLPQGASLSGDQSATSDGRVCRIYNSTKTVLGRPQAVTGLACKGGDGRWQLVTEAPAD
ncbi:MAG: hypothetical protein JWL84_6129 [Rhodospirillales bacterium]|nr:hypothetical protein [Rhodospirillales bacterium]